MNNTTVNSIDLTGYLTYGRFNVNDYVLELGRGEDADGRSGMVLKVYNSDGELLTKEMCYDGEPGLTEAEVNAIRNLFERMEEALPDWQSAELERAAAEKLRNIAELGEDGLGEGTGNRKGLYDLMLKLYNRLYPKIDDDLAAIDEARMKAEKAAEDATVAAANATEAVFGDLKNTLFYKDGDTIKFIDDPEKNALAVSTTNEEESSRLCAFGYVTTGRTQARIKIPLSKFLTNINHVVWERFDAYIVNGGGYGLTSAHDEQKKDYMKYVKYTLIDKVQNCIHVVLENSAGWKLTNNDAISCRCVDVEFVLYDHDPSEGEVS